MSNSKPRASRPVWCSCGSCSSNKAREEAQDSVFPPTATASHLCRTSLYLWLGPYVGLSGERISTHTLGASSAQRTPAQFGFTGEVVTVANNRKIKETQFLCPPKLRAICSLDYIRSLITSELQRLVTEDGCEASHPTLLFSFRESHCWQHLRP